MSILSPVVEVVLQCTRWSGRFWAKTQNQGHIQYIHYMTFTYQQQAPRRTGQGEPAE